MGEGQGVLWITHELDAEALSAFETWYMREHLHERLAIPGFLHGRRFRTRSAKPRFMALYETETPEVLHGSDYIGRLRDPTPQTRAIMPHFKDMQRTTMRSVATQGVFDGACIRIFDLSACEDDTVTMSAWEARVNDIAQAAGICSAHIWRQIGPAAVPTEEARLRGAPDRTVAAALAIEANDEQSLEAVSRSLAQQLPADSLDAPVYHFLCAISSR